MNNDFNLSKAETAVNTLVHKLKSAISDAASAAQEISMSYFYRPNPIRNPIYPRFQYDLRMVQIRAAQERRALAIAKINSIINTLNPISNHTQSFLKQQQEGIKRLHQDANKLNSKAEASASAMYQVGERGLRYDAEQCRKILQSIDTALQESNAAISSSISASPIISGGFDGGLCDVGKVPMISSVSSANVLKDQIYALDLKKYGAPNTSNIVQCPIPSLSSEVNCDRSLLEKATLGGGGPDALQKTVYKPISLPDSYDKMILSAYSPTNHGGRYTAGARENNDSTLDYRYFNGS